MSTMVYWQSGISFLQIQIGATGVMICAACLSRVVAKRHIVAREWLWQAALIGVLASLLIPFVSRATPLRMPELAILPTASAVSTPPTAPDLSDLANPLNVSPNTLSPAVASTAVEASANHVEIQDPAQQAQASVPSASRTMPVRDRAETQPATSGTLLIPWLAEWILRIVALIWFAGVFYHAARGLVGLIICRRVIVSATALNSREFSDVLLRLQRALSLKVLPPIVTTTQVGSPIVIGTLRPHIVLPETALQWMSSAQLFQVLLHETAHIVRRDPLVNFLQVVARALFWHHPLIYGLNRRLSQSREEVCDNFVLVHAGPVDYAETLLQMTERSPRLTLAGGLAMLTESGSLEERVTGLLDGTRDRTIRWPWWRKLAVVSGLLLIPFVCGLVRVTERTVLADEPKSLVADKPSVPVSPTPAPSTPATNSAKPGEKAAVTATGKISGQVLFDKDNRVAADAKVILLPPPPKGEQNYVGRLPLRETTADSEGKFSFDSLTPGKYRVWANLGKQTSRKVRKGVAVMLEEGVPPPQPVELRLADGVTVAARITDKATGKEIPNATIHLVWTDLNDDFVSDGVSPVLVQPLTRERWFFEAWAEGYAKESRWLNLENGKDAATEFQLVRGGEVQGEVRDAEGKPIEGVGMSVAHDNGHEQIAYTKTDKEGRYRLDHLPLGRGLVIRGSKVDWVTQAVKLQLTDAHHKQDVKLSPRPHGGTIAGVVQDRDGRPVNGAVITNMGGSTAEVRETTSDAAGRFQLDNLFGTGILGPEVVVRAQKFAPQRVKVEPGPADKPTEVTIKLEPGHHIVGRVADESGRGLEGVTIYFANGNRPFTAGGQGLTDKDGRFEFDSLPANCPFTLVKSGYSSIDERLLPLDIDKVVAVEMIPVGVVLGQVIDRTTKQPVSSFNVRITFSPTRTPEDPVSSLNSDWIQPGQKFQSDDGKFKLKDLVAGMPLQVMIDADGYETAVQERVVVARSDKAEEVTFEMDRLDPATLRKYRGRFLDANGAPVAGAQLRLIVLRDHPPLPRRPPQPGFAAIHPSQMPSDWSVIRNGHLADQANTLRFLKGTTDKDGRFEFTDVPRKGKVELAWWGETIASGRKARLESLDDATSIKISVPAAATMKGTVDRKQFPLGARIEVAPHDPAVETRSVELRPDQQDFEISNLAPGEYTVRLMTQYVRNKRPGYPDGSITNRRLGSATIKLGAGEVKQIELRKDESPPFE